jgi:AcrR family transcriptional regulator
VTAELLVTDGRPSGPRSRKGIETRARLVDAAKHVFEDHGFLEARISDIAERAGLSHGSFYHYFESKEEVFLEVAVAQEDRLSMHTVVDSGLLDRSVHANVRERVRESNRRYLADYRDEARIMGVIEEVSRYNESVRKVRFERFRHYCQRTERVIRRMQAQGLAETSLDAEFAAQALSAMVTRTAEMSFVQGLLDCSFEDGVDQLTSLCINALQLKD